MCSSKKNQLNIIMFMNSMLQITPKKEFILKDTLYIADFEESNLC